MQDLTVSFLQSSLYWENSVANLAMFEEQLWKIKGKTDILVLPEMFTTGFTMNAEKYAEPMNLTTFKWMKQQSAQTGAAVVGSFIVKEKSHFYNRLLWMMPDGNFHAYDKAHLFRMANEQLVFTAGTSKLIVHWKGWKIFPLICYDLRFPVWSRNKNNEYDVVLYVANWPEARREAWKILLQARAIENLSYVVGVNRIGQDGLGISYAGDSCVVGPKGEWLVQPIDNKEVVVTTVLSMQSLLTFREKFPADQDADPFLFP